MTDSADRTRILAQLAEEQAHRRHHHVTELSELHDRITQLRDDLKATEQSYRTVYRRAITTGLLTGPQLRSLGLPPIDARRRPRTSPSAPSDTSPVHQLHSNAS
jgi:hypothetical protein